jgi:hypothetical protein
MVDRYGRRLEVITLDRGCGPVSYVLVSWHGVLMGEGTPGPGQGYYRNVEAALAYVDVESLVEVIELRQ